MDEIDGRLLVFFSFSRAADLSVEFLLFAHDFLFLNEDLLHPFNDDNLLCLFAQTLVGLGRLQLVGQLSLGFLFATWKLAISRVK